MLDVWRKIASCLIAGVLLAWAFPLSLPPLRIPWDGTLIFLQLPGGSEVGEFAQLPWLAFVALFPLFELARRSTPRAAFGWGYVTGLIWLVLHLNWILSFGWTPLIALCCYFALPMGLFCWALHWLISTNQPGYVLWGSALAWTSLEYLRSFGFWAFPWNLLGYSQAHTPEMIQVADLGGVFLVGFVIALCNAGLFLVLTNIGQVRRRWGHAFLAAAVFLATLGYGEWRLRSMPLAEPEHRLKLALIQGNEDTDEDWSGEIYLAALDAYIEPSRDLAMRWMSELSDWRNTREGEVGPFHEPAMLVVWPEVAIPRTMSPRRSERIPDQLSGLVSERENFALLTGALGRPDVSEDLLNGTLLLSSDDDMEWGHSKVRLVPYGETVPLSGVARFLDYPWPEGDVKSGRSLEPIAWRGFKLASGVCFDNVFGFIYREQVRRGAQVLLLVTNNSWYDLHSGIRQHGDIDILRAVELRRPLARVSTTGWSQIVLPSGIVLPHHETRINAPEVLNSWVEPRDEPTAYSVVGDLFAQLCLAAGLLLIIGVRLQGRSEGLL